MDEQFQGGTVAVVGTAQFPLFPLFGEIQARSQDDCI